MPSPPALRDQARLRRGHQSPTQNSIQSSRTSNWQRSGGMRVGQKAVISQTNRASPSEKARSKLGSDPWESARRKLRHGGSPGGRARRTSGVRPGRDEAPHVRVSGACKSRRRAGAAGFCFLSGAAGRSWPRVSAASGRPRQPRAAPWPGPRRTLVVLGAPTRAPDAGTSTAPGRRFRSREVTQEPGLLSPAGLLPILRRPRALRGRRRRRRRRRRWLLPDAPVGAWFPRGGREVPV